jgi:hypothetical protein
MLCSKGSVPENGGRSDRYCRDFPDFSNGVPFFCQFRYIVLFPTNKVYMMVCASVTVPYSTAACTCESGVVVLRGVKVGREEINAKIRCDAY